MLWDCSSKRHLCPKIPSHRDVSSISNAQLGECWWEFFLTLCVPFLPAKVHEQPLRTSPLLRAPGGRATPLRCIGTTWEITVTSKMHRPGAYLWLQKISAQVTLLAVPTETEPAERTPPPGGIPTLSWPGLEWDCLAPFPSEGTGLEQCLVPAPCKHS